MCAHCNIANRWSEYIPCILSLLFHTLQLHQFGIMPNDKLRKCNKVRGDSTRKYRATLSRHNTIPIGVIFISISDSHKTFEPKNSLLHTRPGENFSLMCETYFCYISHMSAHNYMYLLWNLDYSIRLVDRHLTDWEGQIKLFVSGQILKQCRCKQRFKPLFPKLTILKVGSPLYNVR